jgi:hypothetical protein
MLAGKPFECPEGRPIIITVKTVRVGYENAVPLIPIVYIALGFHPTDPISAYHHEYPFQQLLRLATIKDVQSTPKAAELFP